MSKPTLDSSVLPFCQFGSERDPLGTKGALVRSSASLPRESVQRSLSRRGSGSDAGELVPEAGRQDALHLLHDEVERSEQRAEELEEEGEEPRAREDIYKQKSCK